MVMPASPMPRGTIWLMAAGMLLLAVDTLAAVTAKVSRPNVELNESFTLEIVVDSHVAVEPPDVSPLHADFDVGQSLRQENTTIVNGQLSRSLTWSYVLMAKRTGRLQIPPITVGNEQTQPLTVLVREPSDLAPGEADVFVTAEVDQEETYVQAQVLYRIKVYRAVPTRQPALRDPSFGGAEVLIENAGDDRSYEAILNGRAYNVVERTYAVFPQQSGEVTITPARFEARVLRNGRITGRKVFESDALTINVLPMPAPPAEFPNAAWLPARNLELREDWSRDVDELTAGEPITRNVMISALGQLETQLPQIDPPAVAGVRIYPDKPELSRRVEADGIRGERKDEYALIGVGSGIFELPEVALPWWDVAAGEWRVARLPGRSFTVLAALDPVSEPPAPGPVETQAGQDVQQGTLTVHSSFWRRVSEALAVVWILTVTAWWWSSRTVRARPRSNSREPETPPHKLQTRALKAARKAALAGDRKTLRNVMLEWAELEWPERAPRSIGALAARVSEPLAGELRRLSSVSYGPGAADWDGQELAKALRSFSVVDTADRGRGEELLPPLMPATRMPST